MLNTNIGRHEILHPLPKDDDIYVVEECSMYVFEVSIHR
jgi:hypothetical protein